MKLPAAVALMLLSLGNSAVINAQENMNPKVLRISLPGKSWALQVDAEGFAVEVNETKTDGRRYLRATNATTGVILSLTLEQAGQLASLESCRDVFRQRKKANSKLHPVDVKESQIGDMAVLEFVFPEIGGRPIRQKNVFGCFAKDDSYADIHLSKVRFEPQEEALFVSILNATRLTGPEAGGASSFEPDSKYYLGEGSRYYLKHELDKAIGPYQKALDLEKKDRKLDTNSWRVLVDNLGMAYGITGNLKAAEEVFQYGLSKDPTYPLFSYNMACTYAEGNDLENAMKYLAAAFEYRKNMIAGEHMPDPRKDGSFQRFLRDEKFRKLLDSF